MRRLIAIAILVVGSAVCAGSVYVAAVCGLTVSDANAANSSQEIEVVLHITEIEPSPYWKNDIEVPGDSFIVPGTSDVEPGWVKFTIILSEPYNPNTVYYQDSQEYLFHYDFATELLEPFIGMSPSEYEAVALYAAGQEAVLGAVIVPADSGIQEYGIQFIRYDAYTREEIRDMFNVANASVIADPCVEAFYFPSYEQMAVAEDNRAWFAAEGIEVSSTARWAAGSISGR